MHLQLNRLAQSSPLGVLVDYFAKRRLLLLLDNCEHLIDACAELAAHLMSYCPNLRILTTSREALQVPGELALRVPPLTVPSASMTGGNGLSMQNDAMDFDAVRLFVERAQSVQPDFELSTSNVNAVIHICDRLDGIPLALELAAALLQVLSVDEIAARVDNRFTLLKGGYRTATPRHQALSNAVDWSYELLTPAEQVLLARLSVFVGAWDTEAAEGICADPDPPVSIGLTRQDILPTLRQLVSKSLVVLDQNRTEHTRYRLLKTIHEYATVKLHERKEDSMMKDNHLNYLIDEVEAADTQIGTAQHQAVMTKLDALQNELRAAMTHAEQSGRAEALLRLTSALQIYWLLRSTPEEGQFWLDKALALSSPVDSKWRIAAIYHEMKTFTEDQKKLGPLYPEVQQILEQSRATGSKLAIAQALAVLGAHAVSILHDSAKMRQYAQEALTLFEELHDISGISMMRGWLGWEMKDDPVAHNRWLEHSLVLYRAAGNDMLVGMVQSWQAEIAMRADRDVERGRALMKQSLETIQTLGDSWMLLNDHENFGHWELRYGDRAYATHHFGRALELACTINGKRA